VVTVFIPEYVVGHWWEHALHNQSALRLKGRLLFEPGVMVVSVPWQLRSSSTRDLARFDASLRHRAARGPRATSSSEPFRVPDRGEGDPAAGDGSGDGGPTGGSVPDSVAKGV
jgi:hypothetical protein